MRQSLHDKKHLQEYGTHIRKFLKSHRGTFGELDWNSPGLIWDYLNRQMVVLDTANNWEGLIDFCAEVISQINEALLVSDDSNGILSDCIYSAFHYLEELVNGDNLTRKLQQLLFARLLGLLDEKEIYHWDCGHNIWAILSRIVESKDEYQQLLAKMEASLKGLNGWSWTYSRSNMVSNQIVALHRFGLKREAQDLTLAHLDLYDIRKVHIKHLIKTEDFVEAHKVIKAGIQQAKTEGYPGLVNDFNQFLIDLFGGS